MITIKSYALLDTICFSDFKLLEVKIGELNKTLELNLEGVWLIESSGPKELGPGYVKISNFDKFSAKSSNSVLKKSGDASYEQIKQMKEIDDHKVGENYLIFFGFSDDGSWLECEVVGGKIEAIFNS